MDYVPKNSSVNIVKVKSIFYKNLFVSPYCTDIYTTNQEHTHGREPIQADSNKYVSFMYIYLLKIILFDIKIKISVSVQLPTRPIF